MKYLALMLALALCTAFAGCTTTASQDGAILGGALGAGLGAIVGNQSGHAGEGALIGGAAGALTGAVVGEQYRKDRSHVYRKVPATAGHYETRVVRGPSGELHEERVFIPH